MPAPLTFHRWLRCLVAASCVLVACGAAALCIPYDGDRELARFEKLMGTNPAKVAELVSARLAAAKAGDAALRMKLYSIQAEAYGSLELYAEARAATESGFVLTDDKRSAAYVNLLHQRALITYDEQSIPGLIATIEANRKLQDANSPADACLLVSLGALEHFSGRSHEAGAHLTQAYRMSVGESRKSQRMYAADTLSLVMSDEGDVKQALALLQEVIDYQTETHADFDLAVSRFMRGGVLRDSGDHRGALAEFDASRRLAMEMKDPVGVAYASLYMCMSNIDLGAIKEARAQCDEALPPFTEAKTIDPKKQTLAALAEIDLREGKAASALDRVNAVLGGADGDLAQVRVAAMHELRARAHAALGHHEQALADYKLYMQRTKAAMDAQRVRETTALRTRFETDREIERNEFLRREIDSKNERLAAQAARLRWIVVAAIAGVGLIGLLTYLLITNRRQKALLARLARMDDLTELPNRRRTLELALEAFETSRRNAAPLTLALIDLDHFKHINDRFGHATGDFVLQEFARIGRRAIRDSDVFGRWGGEEFLIVLPNTTLDIALGIVERVREAALHIKGGVLAEELRVSLSAGLATNEGDPAGLEAIIASADAALYDAKKNGRDLVCVAPESYDLASTGIRRALKSSGITLSTGSFERRRPPKA